MRPGRLWYVLNFTFPINLCISYFLRGLGFSFLSCTPYLCTYTSCHSLARSLFLEFGGSQTSSWLALPGWISGGIQIWFLAYLSGFPMRGFLFYVDKVKIQRAMPIVLTLKVWIGPSWMFSTKRKLVGSNSDGNRYHKRTLRYNSLKKFKSSGSWQIKTINKKVAWFNKVATSFIMCYLDWQVGISLTWLARECSLPKSQVEQLRTWTSMGSKAYLLLIHNHCNPRTHAVGLQSS